MLSLYLGPTFRRYCLLLFVVHCLPPVLVVEIFAYLEGVDKGYMACSNGSTNKGLNMNDEQAYQRITFYAVAIMCAATLAGFAIILS